MDKVRQIQNESLHDMHVNKTTVICNVLQTTGRLAKCLSTISNNIIFNKGGNDAQPEWFMLLLNFINLVEVREPFSF